MVFSTSGIIGQIYLNLNARSVRIFFTAFALCGNFFHCFTFLMDIFAISTFPSCESFSFFSLFYWFIMDMDGARVFLLAAGGLTWHITMACAVPKWATGYTW
jgi:hypothetical protein